MSRLNQTAVNEEWTASNNYRQNLADDGLIRLDLSSISKAKVSGKSSSSRGKKAEAVMKKQSPRKEYSKKGGGGGSGSDSAREVQHIQTELQGSSFPLSTTSRSPSLPFPITHVKRTQSEEAIEEGKKRAEARDWNMFFRLCDGIKKKGKGPHDTQALQNIVKSRSKSMESPSSPTLLGSREPSNSAIVEGKFRDNPIPIVNCPAGPPRKNSNSNYKSDSNNTIYTSTTSSAQKRKRSISSLTNLADMIVSSTHATPSSSTSSLTQSPKCGLLSNLSSGNFFLSSDDTLGSRKKKRSAQTEDIFSLDW